MKLYFNHEKQQASIRGDWFSSLFYPRDILVITGLLLACISIALLSLGYGLVVMSPIEVVEHLSVESDPVASLVIEMLRAPRVIIAALAGAALAMAGLILQTLTRVSLASPSLLATVDGAGLGAAIFLWFGSSATLPLIGMSAGIVVSALLGALLSLLLLLLLLGKERSVLKLVLMGIALSALLKAGITLAMLKGPIYVTSQVQLWLIGSLSHVDWPKVEVFAPLWLILIMISLGFSRSLTLMQLSEASQQSLGLNFKQQHLFMAILAAAFTALAVSFVGGVGFVGLVVPHLARLLIRSQGAALQFACVLIGANLLMLADLIGRSVWAGSEIPAGVFTAILGAPFFMYLFIFKARLS